MKTAIKSEALNASVIRKPEGKPKVKMGTGKNILFMADTLFDDDLK
jgi:hypothetical protein